VEAENEMQIQRDSEQLNNELPGGQAWRSVSCIAFDGREEPTAASGPTTD